MPANRVQPEQVEKEFQLRIDCDAVMVRRSDSARSQLGSDGHFKVNVRVFARRSPRFAANVR